MEQAPLSLENQSESRDFSYVIPPARRHLANQCSNSSRWLSYHFNFIHIYFISLVLTWIILLSIFVLWCSHSESGHPSPLTTSPYSQNTAPKRGINDQRYTEPNAYLNWVNLVETIVTFLDSQFPRGPRLVEKIKKTTNIHRHDLANVLLIG